MEDKISIFFNSINNRKCNKNSVKYLTLNGFYESIQILNCYFQIRSQPENEFLRSAQNADTIVKSTDSEILERKTTTFFKVYTVMLASLINLGFVLRPDTVRTRNELIVRRRREKIF